MLGWSRHTVVNLPMPVVGFKTTMNAIPVAIPVARTDYPAA